MGDVGWGACPDGGRRPTKKPHTSTAFFIRQLAHPPTKKQTDSGCIGSRWVCHGTADRPPGQPSPFSCGCCTTGHHASPDSSAHAARASSELQAMGPCAHADTCCSSADARPVICCWCSCVGTAGAGASTDGVVAAGLAELRSGRGPACWPRLASPCTYARNIRTFARDRCAQQTDRQAVHKCDTAWRHGRPLLLNRHPVPAAAGTPPPTPRTCASCSLRCSSCSARAAASSTGALPGARCMPRPASTSSSAGEAARAAPGRCGPSGGKSAAREGTLGSTRSAGRRSSPEAEGNSACSLQRVWYGVVVGWGGVGWTGWDQGGGWGGCSRWVGVGPGFARQPVSHGKSRRAAAGWPA